MFSVISWPMHGETKVRKCFVSTHSTALPGKPSNKHRSREMPDEDGEEVGQTEVFNKTVKRKNPILMQHRL